VISHSCDISFFFTTLPVFIFLFLLSMLGFVKKQPQFNVLFGIAFGGLYATAYPTGNSSL
jgi:hypothetical protein